MSRDHVSNADVFVFIVFMSIKMSESLRCRVRPLDKWERSMALVELRRWSIADVTVWTGAEWSSSLSGGKRLHPNPSVCATHLWNALMGGNISRKSQVRDSAFSVQPSREKSVDKMRAWALSDSKTLINIIPSNINHEGQQILNQLQTVTLFTL